MYRGLQDVRERLDLLDEDILYQLRKRSRYKQNPSLYQTATEGEASFLQIALSTLEDHHEAIGRYDFPDQRRITPSSGKGSIIKRKLPAEAGIDTSIHIDISGEIIKFYTDSLSKLCAEGDEPFTHGETVACDALTILLLNERISFGKYVAQSKIDKDRSLLDITDRDELTERLRNYKREEEVLSRAQSIAVANGLNHGIAYDFFKWIIDTTIHLEVDYIFESRARLGNSRV